MNYIYFCFFYKPVLNFSPLISAAQILFYGFKKVKAIIVKQISNYTGIFELNPETEYEMPLLINNGDDK